MAIGISETQSPKFCRINLSQWKKSSELWYILPCKVKRHYCQYLMLYALNSRSSTSNIPRVTYKINCNQQFLQKVQSGYNQDNSLFLKSCSFFQILQFHFSKQNSCICRKNIGLKPWIYQCFLEHLNGPLFLLEVQPL